MTDSTINIEILSDDEHATVAPEEKKEVAPRVEQKQLVQKFTAEKKFTTLKKFVHEMSCFFNDDLAVKLYNHLLRKTTMKNRVPVARHIELFTEFCTANRKHIVEGDVNFAQTRLEYSSRVCIDFAKIFADISKDDCAEETKSVLFDHLLVLSMVFDSGSSASEIIKLKNKSPQGELKELFDDNPFLADMMKKVESQVKPGANPMQAMTEMMSSGLLQELVSGMQENIEKGDLDMNQLMGSVQRMTASLPQEQLAALNPMLQMAQAQAGNQ
tara:strand:+ start:9956 stop:10768 length:813 start_codon:yes stop_codon:yes gene_type:complete